MPPVLAAGVPLIGIAGNLDQFLNMQGVLAMRAGSLLRADRLREDQLFDVALNLLERPGPRAAAVAVAQQFQRYDPGARLEGLLAQL